ncbi:hypothetical protein D0A36_04635 [Xanthomonas campestris]|nr:hypothetical protein D0A41_06950 [Xanthomonas campestris]RFF60258.1 hypothetical protein D0A36_04635 [Xanthomonas campestris]
MLCVRRVHCGVRHLFARPVNPNRPQWDCGGVCLLQGRGRTAILLGPGFNEGVAMKTLLGTALAASLLLLAGCAKDMGEEFVGKWVNAKAPKNVLSIEHNGESFIIRDTRPELFGNGVKTKNYPAVLRGDVLQVSNGVGTINYAIDQSTGNLSTGESEYTPVK